MSLSTNNSHTMVSVTQLSHQFHGQEQPLFGSLSFAMEGQQSLAIVGESGCGKSSLLNAISGQFAPQQGEISIADTRIDLLGDSQRDQFRAEHIGMIFQQFRLLDCLSVRDNITFIARYLKRSFDPLLDTLIEALNLGSCLNTPVSALSGGQQQRVAIARALLHRPTLILADEPTGNLDQRTSAQVADYLFDLIKHTNTTMIIVTHSATIADRADRVATLANGKLV